MNIKKLTALLLMAVSTLTASAGAQNQKDWDNPDTIFVAQDGSGHFRNVAEAVDVCRAFTDYHKVIFVKKGIYKEKIVIPSYLTNIEICGEDRDKTIITFDDHANITRDYLPNDHKLGTFGSYTVKVEGNDITFQNITIENNAPKLGQAVALHTEGDRLSFINCRFLGNQDTVYTGVENTRLYFNGCYIEGTTDFIFGPSIAWFENCDIVSKANSYVTAASTPRHQKYGYIFNNCRLTAAEGVTKCYLGRPWRQYAYTLFMNCELGKHICAEGWQDWKKDHDKIRYMEYNNKGEGSNVAGRVDWASQLSPDDAKRISMREVFNTASRWEPNRRFTFNTRYPGVHDPVMAKGEDGRYYVFSTGMGVGVMSSPDMKTWQPEKSVFAFNAIPAWTSDTVRGFRGHIWAPDITKRGDRWYLYYSCSTFGKNGSAIGLATNKTLDPKSPDFKWEDQGMVIASHKHQDNWNAIDPNLIFDKKGTGWLVYGSFWDGIQLIKLGKDLKTPVTKPVTIARRVGRKLTLAEIDDVSKFTIEGNDTIEAGENAIEAPFIIYRDGYYYLFVSHDYCCRGEASTYKTVYGRSRNVQGPYLDKEGRDMAKGGGTLLYGPDNDFFGIGHNSAYQFDGKWYFLSHAYDKARNGEARMFLQELKFGKDKWIIK